MRPFPSTNLPAKLEATLPELSGFGLAAAPVAERGHFALDVELGKSGRADLKFAVELQAVGNNPLSRRDIDPGAKTDVPRHGRLIRL